MPKGYLKIIEKVPVSFTRRLGDWVQEGGNNALIVLGTDRAKSAGPAGVDDGLGTVDADGGGKGTGTIIAVVGRKDLENGDVDVTQDDAFLYLSMKTKVDENLQTTFETADTGPAAVLKSDHLRLVFRKNLKVSATDKATHVHFDGDKLNVDLQGKTKLSLTADGGATIDVQDNQIVVGSDGSITITSKSKVTVNTKTAQVNADTEAVVKSKKVTIDASDTQITGKLTVTGQTTIGAVLTVAGAANVAGVVGCGGLTGPSGAPVPGALNVAGDVSTGGISLKSHKHSVAGVKAGPDAAVTLPPIP